ncbi:SusC/RagA family TonB-linked outer membrane protein [Hyunsoonleella ulvae]|uniref:SusC/RagA family TonB-linked outer membrane protein n=1 Tax=Hyunsoonleella ulvae TaxID=2799948 RepID=UPI0019399F33|nr:TonB-dependent receptor [Hyunsoonleella ulvae]
MKKLKLLLFTFFIGTLSVFAQDNVSGVVTDEQNVPIPGVNVLIKGTATGTSTDFDGNYQIQASNGDVIVFSYLGYKTQEVSYSGQSTLDVQLLEDTAQLEEVVVIGYGSVKRTDLTGSVASIGSDAVIEQRKTDVGQALQGRLAGVDVRTLNNKPGAPLSITVRGNGALRNNNQGNDGVSDDPTSDLGSPLYVVDGIFVDNINALNPADIQQIDILKDASSTAIYGARGANGVVIITTKSGIEGRTRFNYDATFGIRSVVNSPDFYSGDEYVAFVNDVVRAREFGNLLNTGPASAADYNNIVPDTTVEFIGAEEQANALNGNYTDWIGLFQETGIQTSHTLSASGGQDGLVYNASVGYLKDEGVVGIEAFERYNLSGSLSKKVNDQLTFGVKTYIAFSEREEGSRELFRSSFRLAPTVDPFEDDGTLDLIPDEQDQRFINPIYEKNGAWRVNTKRFDIIANAFLEYKPLKWLNLKTQFSPSLVYNRFGEHRALLTKAARNDPRRTRAIYNSASIVTYTWDNIANMNFDIDDNNNLAATLISSLYHKEFERGDIQTRNLADEFLFFNTGQGTDIRAFNSGFIKDNIASFAARLNYSHKDKYLLTLTGRYDGASRLAVGNKWDFFPSAAFAWKVSQEEFMQNVSWLNNMKVRLTYGQTGNIDTIGAYQSFSSLSGGTYLFGDDLATTQVIAGLPNSELTWAVTTETNIGIDLGLFNNRVNLTVDYYNKDTDGSLFPRSLLAVSGFGSAIGNFGEVRNRGVEVVLNTTNIQTEDFRWRTSLNFSKNEAEILKIEGDVEEVPFGRHGVTKVGEDPAAIFSFENDGIWQLDEYAEAATFGARPGQYKFVDQNNDGVINNDDKVVIGSPTPDWFGGMTNTFTYKNFEARVQINTRQGTLGHSEWYQNFTPYQNDQAKFNKINLDYWTPNNPDASRPALAYAHPGEYYYEEFDFVKIGNIGFTYTLPSNVLDKLKLSGMRLSLDIQNPFVFTDYEGPDPETGLQNSYSSAYMTKTVLFGLNVSL